MFESTEFPRYRVTTFGRRSDWRLRAFPSGIDPQGVVVGRIGVPGLPACGFIFDGEELRTITQESSFGFNSIDSDGFAIGYYSFWRGKLNRLVVTNVNDGKTKVHELENLRYFTLSSIGHDGSCYGSSFHHDFWRYDNLKSLGYHAGVTIERQELELGSLRTFQLAENIAEELDSVLGNPKHDSFLGHPPALVARRDSFMVSRNKKGQTLVIITIGIRPQERTCPIIVECDGTMRFLVGPLWYEFCSGVGSAVLAEDGSVCIMGEGGGSFPAYWFSPEGICNQCELRKHAMFSKVPQDSASLTPTVCSCCRKFWRLELKRDYGRCVLAANSNDIWVGKVATAGEIGKRQLFRGAIWKKNANQFEFSMLENLIEPPGCFSVLGAEAINAAGQIACEVIDQDGCYFGARLDPIL